MKKLIIFLLLPLFLSCAQYHFSPIPGFTDETNESLNKFFARHVKTEGRKVAVFDGDGTVFGQAPHYLADECLFEYASSNPEKKPDVIARMKRMSNVSIPYVQLRVHFFEGDTLEKVRNMGVKCFREHYSNKIFQPMNKLIQLLKMNGFEIWIVTASPEALYQKFLSEELNLPITNIIGVKSVIHGGKITSTIVQPIPQDHGKKEAIETFVQARPLLVGGNSRGDKEMIEFSSDLKLIINPDEHIAPDQKESISDYAKHNKWLIIRIDDVPEPDFPSISSKKFGVRINKTKSKSSISEK